MRNLVLIVVFISVFILLSGCSGLCPPQGPWPMPPWCQGSSQNISSGTTIPGDNIPNVTIPVIPTIPTIPQKNETVAPEEKYITKYLPSQVPIIGRVEFRNIEDLPLSITIMAWGEGIPTNPNLHAWFKDQQRKGAQHYSGVSVWNSDAWKKVSDLPDDVKTAYVIDFDGNPVYMQEDVYLNFLDPAMQTRIKKEMKEHMDAGTDGFVFDEVSGTADAVMMGSGPFDNYSLSGFRDYLKSEYTASELQQKGITDIDTFNYRDFLVKGGYRSVYSNGHYWDNPAPFQHDYYTYLREETNNKINELISYTKSYSQTKGKTLVFSANADPLARTNLFKFYDNLNVYVFEHEWWPNWRKEQGSEFNSGVPDIPSMKYARSIGTWAGAMPQITEMNKFPDVYTGTRFFTHEMAETYAAMGYYMYFPDVDYIGIKFDSNRSMLYPYYNFVRDNPAMFLNLTTPAEVAVAKPYNVLDGEGSAIDGAKGFSLLLCEANIPHDVILISNISSKYKVVVTAGQSFTDAEVEKLLSFARDGGTVIATDSRFAMWGGDSKSISRPALDALKTEGIHTLGKGKFIFFDEDLQYKVWGPRDPVAIQTIRNAVEQYIDPNTAPADVKVLPYVSKDGKIVIHMVNYAFTGKDFTNQTDFQAKVKLPAGYSVAGKSLHIMSPDFSGNQTAAIEESGGWLTFTVPSLYIWDVAILE